MDRIQNSRLRMIVCACLPIAGLAIGSTADAACVDSNTCFGTGAMQQHVSGGGNSAFGFQALAADVNGSDNTALGAKALSNAALPQFGLGLCGGPLPCGNSAVGASALNSNTQGWANTAVGAGSLARTTTGALNIAVGFSALENNSTGSNNIAIGFDAMFFNTTGSGSIAIGSHALNNNEGLDNIAIGGSAITNFPFSGNKNVAMGLFAMGNALSGDSNVAVGASALAGDKSANNQGSYNTAIGAKALVRNATGNYNTAAGYQSMQGHGDPATTTPNFGNYNAAYGTSTLRSNQGGNSNTATGAEALLANTEGSNNTANGSRALRSLTTGMRNVAVGYRAGVALTTGSDNITIGAGNQGKASDTGVIRIGVSANQKKTFVAGIRGVKTGLTGATAVMIDANGQLGTVSSSRSLKEDIQPMGNVSDRLFALRPVTFRYKEAYDDGSKPITFGLIAEEVAEAFPELVVNDADGKPETVRYDLVATLLLNEFQKEHQLNLKQAEQLLAQSTKLAEVSTLKQQLAEIKVLLVALQAQELQVAQR